MIDYSLILRKHYAGKNWSLKDDDYEGLTWGDESPKPTRDELDALWPALQQSIVATAYQRDRAAEYPSFAEQFDTLYHGGYDAWKATIDSVKARYPKP